MNFSVGDRIRVTRFCEENVDFYATISFMGLYNFEINNCSDIEFENKLIAMPDSEFFGLDSEDYYTLVAEQEDSEEPVISYINDMYNEVPTQYVVEVQGSYVNDIHLRGSTKMGGYWGSYTPDNEKLDIRNVWITDDYRKALGIAYLVNGEVRKFKG
ncbi:hypothetical protein P3U44_07015 [Mammaliicoccus sciuri]|uniref:hypothetical protein n=1 Tax=Mammaliicoccus sciuri TaxID=1296 RepID=UPI00194DBAD7|nr:hypothetical protein [Mammaliicoccus sciuri]WQJ75264.1 hypothetical protein P3U44_07015 [Mammaliicoccus sciuri]